MDIRNTKINIFSNSSELLEFLKTKEINNYTFHFEPLEQKQVKNETFIDEEGIVHDEIDILVLNSDLLSKSYRIEEENGKLLIKDLFSGHDECEKWFYDSDLKHKYEFVFLYGKHQPIYNKDIDIHFKNFDIFKNFFEVFYYLFNGVDYCSVDINDIIYSFGTRPYGLKCFTFESIEEILVFLEMFDDEINDIVYIEKSTSDIFQFDFLEYEVEEIGRILDGKHHEPNLFCFTAIISDENNERWKKLLIV